jgi:arachidonate 15-lipoxygenase
MTDLIQSAFAVATARQLAKQHPLNALLAPHYMGLLQINALGEKTLLAPGGIVDQILEPGLAGGLLLIKAAYENWRFLDLEPDADLARRGLDDAAALPYCPYRDDGMLIWALIGDYVRDYLQIFYGNPASDPANTLRAIREDYELQAWANELSRESTGPGNVPGFPRRIDDFATLHRILRLLIWIAGPRHAAVNFPQIEYTAFVPNQPTAIYLLPEDKSANFILDMMPPVEAAKTAFQVSFQLAGLHLDQLLDYAGNFEGDGPNVAARNTVMRYKQQLEGAISDEINRRNAERQELSLLPYPYFLPKNIPNGTSV